LRIRHGDLGWSLCFPGRSHILGHPQRHTLEYLSKFKTARESEFGATIEETLAMSTMLVFSN